MVIVITVTNYQFQPSVAPGPTAAVSLTLTRTCGGTTGTTAWMPTMSLTTTMIIVCVDVGDVPLLAHPVRFLVCPWRDASQKKHWAVESMVAVPLHIPLTHQKHLINILTIGFMATAKIVTVDMDDIGAYVVSEDSHRSGPPPLSLMRASQTIAESRGGEKPVPQYPEASAQQECSLHHQYSRSSTSSSNMRMRALTPGSSFHSSSPSLSPSPSLSANAYPHDSPPLPTLMSPVNSSAVSSRAPGTNQHYPYCPSMPYSRGSRVSTALRPAFENTRQWNCLLVACGPGFSVSSFLGCTAIILFCSVFYTWVLFFFL